MMNLLMMTEQCLKPAAAPEPAFDVSVISPAGRPDHEGVFRTEALNRVAAVSHPSTAPRVLGPVRDGVGADRLQRRTLGRLGGGVPRTVMQYQPGHGFFVATCTSCRPTAIRSGPMAFRGDVHAGRILDARARETSAGLKRRARRRYYE